MCGDSWFILGAMIAHAPQAVCELYHGLQGEPGGGAGTGDFWFVFVFGGGGGGKV